VFSIPDDVAARGPQMNAAGAGGAALAAAAPAAAAGSSSSNGAVAPASSKSKLAGVRAVAIKEVAPKQRDPTRPPTPAEVQAAIDAVHERAQDVIRRVAQPLALYRGRWVPERIPSHDRKGAVHQFQSGQRPIVVVTAAGSLGRSLHAARDCGNPSRRVHFICEVPW